jgi:hypothetical protein
MRFDVGNSPGRYHRLGVIVDGMPTADTADNAGCAIIESQQSRYMTHNVGCFVSLKKGQTADISYAQADPDDWKVDKHSSFTGVWLGLQCRRSPY